jgi:hypothetical protein
MEPLTNSIGDQTPKKDRTRNKDRGQTPEEDGNTGRMVTRDRGGVEINQVEGGGNLRQERERCIEHGRQNLSQG